MLNSKKIIASALCSTMLFASSSVCIPNAYASEIAPTEYRVVDSVTTDSSLNFNLVNSLNNIDINVEYTDDGFVVNSLNNGNEKSTLIYNSSTGIATLNGKDINLEITEPDFNADTNSDMSVYATDYVYVAPASLSFKGVATSFSDVATLMTGVIVIGAWLGVKLPNKLVSDKVSKALGAIGVTALIVERQVSGTWKADLVRTKDKFNTGYPGSINQYQYKFRYQDINSSLTIGPWKIDFAVDSVGDWWFQDKPMR
ncbi:hypothetical protein [Lysinibacillus sp. OF-1]|uniref:hypothetical protein n=1 Tax=Lysinibacillus sp. OF-1 TaxID=2972483 RepID=UPI00232BCF6E|nr:hypothetical protein [Lysinibacillus sp. OF-1]WCH45853.1 hypothetical protein NV349_12120 [Lysinibacillus sp. OF-1]